MIYNLFFVGISLSLLSAYLVANSLRHHNSYASLRTRPQRFVSLDGLRGYLALGVFLHHGVMYWYHFQNGDFSRPPEDIIQNLGKVSVAIFFLITGFLFTNKLLNSKGSINWFRLYLGRIKRLLPLYAFVLLIIAIIVIFQTNGQLQVTENRLTKDILKWLLFHGDSVNGYEHTGMIIAGVDWSLKYEWLFYFSLPLISLLIRAKSLILYVLVITLCVYASLNPGYLFTFDSKFFVLFLLGGIVAKVYRVNECQLRGPNWLHSSLFVVTLIVAMTYSETLDLIHCLLIGVLFYYFIAGQSFAGLLTKQASCILGEISYSIYLLHGLVLYLMFFNKSHTEIFVAQPALYFLVIMPVVSALIVYLSHLSFTYIEQWRENRILQIANFKIFSFYKG